MLDAKYIKDNLEEVAEKLATRGYQFDIAEFKAQEAKRKDLQERTQELQSQRNTISKEIGKRKSKGEDASDIFAKVNDINDELKVIEKELKDLQDCINNTLLSMPNLPADDVPVGKDESENVEIKKWGTPREFHPEAQAKDHADIGEILNMIDFKAAAKITGSRFVVLKSKIAKLHRALTQFMLDMHTEKHGYEELYVPYMVNNDSLYGTGQLPKFSEDLFKLEGDFEYSLIPTAEVPITNLVRDEILDTESLPRYYTAHTPCFRSEAGSYGRDTKGLIRQHQFEKVELVHITIADKGEESLELLTSHAEKVLQKLNLPYRVVKLCTGDMGFSAKKTYDLEVWIPSQNTYREISSCSWCGDFQARRMKARHKNPSMKKPELVHTLNGSGLAVGRTLLAIIENYQQEDGSIMIPEALINYMGGISVIK
ncbi:serine--tRNA ligase [Francisella noatunensis]|uniref:Serine--tRNA ligase n=1 Tax=Francisella noatunensis TaxID=657445 RepID=A0A9Q2KXU0_9GAMM|nr:MULTISPECIES: serine--tRNA ligase [Francisella]MBK2029351.1 serine--tRNA ligase [Francisella noatunensis]MBK2033885.1 serine--tRNA ligase [Francisella noatunensis]MBK2049331.1 serine--tRNA ligase [Francisella noatunensis]MBK2050668.1 serine--tRNA ligase [Francisella noatunensis]MBK2052181.1 serine--tRNA ligase [Francisella noatunensis]